MTAPALLWGPRHNAPPSPTWISPYTLNKHVRRERPEHVCFLGGFEELKCHFLRETREERPRSVPCTGEGCERCAAGLKVIKNLFAPALINNPGETIGGNGVWRRVAYYVPEAASREMEGGNQRGKMFACWRELVGSVNRFRSRFLGYANTLNEPAFDVRVILQHHFFPGAESIAAVRSMLDTLPPSVSPPLNQPPEVTPITPEEREVVRRKLAEFRAKAERPVPSTTEADLLSKGTSTIINAEVNDQLPDGHPAKKPAKRKGGAA